MKIGMILECSSKGPDADIYPYAAKKFCSELEIAKPETMVNKQNLMADGPAVAQLLLETGCDYVFFIWDRMPKWSGSGNCESHRTTLKRGLDALNIPEDKIIACCIKDMLESWMLGDGAAITSYFQSLAPSHKLQAFPDYKSAIEQSKPEEKLERYNGRFNKFSDNFKIVQLISDWTKIAKRNDSFEFFKEQIEKICPQ